MSVVYRFRIQRISSQQLWYSIIVYMLLILRYIAAWCFLEHVFAKDWSSGLYTCCRLVEQCNFRCLLQMFALVDMTCSIYELFIDASHFIFCWNICRDLYEQFYLHVLHWCRMIRESGDVAYSWIVYNLHIGNLVILWCICVDITLHNLLIFS